MTSGLSAQPDDLPFFPLRTIVEKRPVNGSSWLTQTRRFDSSTKQIPAAPNFLNQLWRLGVN